MRIIVSWVHIRALDFGKLPYVGLNTIDYKLEGSGVGLAGLYLVCG